MYTERLQLLLSREQRRRLDAESRRSGSSVAGLIRQAIDARFGGVAPDDRLRAASRIRSLGGRFMSPSEINSVIDEERAEVIDVPARSSPH